MTYRDALRIQIKAMQKLYNNAEALRDCATGREKFAFNNLRGNLPDIWNEYRKIADDDDSFLDRELKGDYSINVTIEDL